MKKILSLLLVLCISLSLVACDDVVEQFLEPTINGLWLSEYTIVYNAEGSDYDLRAAEYIKSEILTRFDFEIPMIDDDEPRAEHEIVIGNTSRPITESAKSTERKNLEFALVAENGHIALYGDYFIIAAAAYYFINTHAFEWGLSTDISAVEIHEPIVRPAKNFVMLIGDGMGVYHTKMFDYIDNTVEYSDGEDIFYGYLFPNIGESKTASLSGVTDSAAGGTALSTGYKTYNDYVGIDLNGNELKSLTELAAERGMATAVMSTEVKTGATPSTFTAHASSRDDKDDILADQTDLILNYGTIINCGFDYYNTKYMKVIENKVTETLDTISADEDGFFIMYEEAHIDKHSHKNDLEKTFEAVVRFNQVIARFMEFAFYNPETFVLITADHETGGLYPTEDGTLGYTSEEHTIDNVPVFAYGNAADFFDGKAVENTEIAKQFAKAMGVDDFGDGKIAFQK